ncbi:MAG: capsular biosynthesis protein [Pseudomonadota bacterium]|jgi:capsular polysaccharide export protein|nr:capsular biosynthesis protein [Pseudomonadota bacterium]
MSAAPKTIAYVAGWTAKKDTVFRALGEVAGNAVRLPFIGWSPRGFADSAVRAQACFDTAKKKPASGIGRAIKYRLIWGQYNWSRRYFTRHPDRIAVCWNGLTGSRRAFMEGARDAGAARVFAELAPFPGRITLDPVGVNYLNALPRDGMFYTEWAGDEPARIGDGWRALGSNLKSRPSRRADVGQADGADLADQGPFLFVPLQVPDDSQINLFAGWSGSVAGMLNALAEASAALPEGWYIRVKEHPSAKQAMGDALTTAIAKSNGRMRFDNKTDTFAQVAAARAVVTINSSVGLQAMFFNKPVITLGQAYFAIPGVVHPANDADALRAAFSEIEEVTFDRDLRAAFLNYLDQVYYPTLTPTGDGTAKLPESVKKNVIDAAIARSRL